MGHPPYSIPQLLAPPCTQRSRPPFCLLRVVGLDEPQMKFIHSGSGNGPGAPGLWAFICTADLHGEKGPPDRKTAVISRGQDRRGRRGCGPASSTRAEAAAVSSCRKKCWWLSSSLPLRVTEKQTQQLQAQEINFCGAYSRFLLPSGAPCPRFANLEEQGLASGFLGTNPSLQEGTCSYGKCSLTFKSIRKIHETLKYNLALAVFAAQESVGQRTNESRVRFRSRASVEGG